MKRQDSETSGVFLENRQRSEFGVYIDLQLEANWCGLRSLEPNIESCRCAKTPTYHAVPELRSRSAYISPMPTNEHDSRHLPRIVIKVQREFIHDIVEYLDQKLRKNATDGGEEHQQPREGSDALLHDFQIG